jgi:large subunit ribosomal protein L24
MARIRRDDTVIVIGGVIEKEGPIHISNVMPVDPKEDKPTRVGTEVDAEGKRHRVTKRSGTRIDA